MIEQTWRSWWAALSVVVLVLAPGLSDGFQHGDWQLTSNERSVEAYSLDRTGSGVRFIVLLPYGNCAAYAVGLESMRREEWMQAAPASGLVELSIDDQFPHRGRLSAAVQVDADRHRMLFHRFSDLPDLVAELRDGAMLDLRLWTGGRHYDLYFSLRGSRAVMDRCAQVCRFAQWRRQRDQDFDLLKAVQPHRLNVQ